MVFGILAMLHIVVAATGTTHILVNKSDFRSAIGWIGRWAQQVDATL